MSDRVDIEAVLARCTFPEPGSRVLCAVSGGADSTAMLFLAVTAGCDVSAVHVHHGLRTSADDDAACAAASAERLNVPLRVERIEIEDGPNLEARARAARKAAIGGDHMAGHTADDQAETLLLALLRGAGATGLAAIRPGPLHPILALRAAETRAICASEGFAVAVDHSNRDPRFRRNRLRHEAIPLLADVADRDVTPLLARTAGLLRDDDDLLTSLADAIDPADAGALAAAPLPLARRAIRTWLDLEGYPPDMAGVDRVLDVARGVAAACQVTGVGRVERRSGRLTLVAPEAPAR